MATEIKKLMKPTDKLKPCDAIIFRDGVQVALLGGASAKLIDRFVREVAEYTGEPVDWHYVGGRAVVLTTGDYDKVRDAISQLHIAWLE